ncbi:sensor histidine kinase [Brachybacterium sp. MASK1Z-5]|uniref:histidine kinase n=1 Tax=Brachybacterium halotolerans TaxID=2795215 RepID=A0ABS1B6D2_9MICO|nr:sensor histidine kinase [Brachybacterium halotolerans]MBK0330198.1 sensor histidine kinase [Brachybacterium halotolerans]
MCARDGADPAPRTRGRRGPGRVVALLPALVALLIQVPPTLAIGVWTETAPALVAARTAAAALSALALLAIWTRPGPTVIVIAPLALVLLFLPPPFGPPPVALGIALVIALVRAAPVWALATACTTWAVGVVLAELLWPSGAPQRIIAGTVILAVCLGVGMGIRSRAERMRRREALLEQRRREAEQAERDQIARELHDVLSHSLSQISVQAGMGLHLFDRDPAKARESLGNIRRLAGGGLEEARGVLATLRGEEAPLTPEPQLADLPALLEQHRGLGLAISLDSDIGGAGPLGTEPHGTEPRAEDAPAGRTQATAVRIVREALTNVVRHSGAETAEVRLRREGGALRIDVADDGVGTALAHPGAGIRSMRDRSELLGGTLSLGPGPQGRGTVVTARLPWGHT